MLIPALHDQAAAFFELTLTAAERGAIGIIVPTDDAFRHRNLLYRARSELANPDFATIAILFSPDNPETDLWLMTNEIVRKYCPSLNRQSTQQTQLQALEI